MTPQLPVLIIVVPLIAAFFIAAAGWICRRICFFLALAALTASFCGSVGVLHVVVGGGAMTYRLGGWAPPWGIAYHIDSLSGLVLVVVSAVALINLVATRETAAAEFPLKGGSFYTLYVLFVTGLLGIVATGDAFNLYVLLEIASLTGYALIGMGEGRAPLAGLNYIFMGTIGASFYLLGIGYLYLVTGSLNMADLAALLPRLYPSRVVQLAFMICMTGLFIKMAFFPLHMWLPDAYVHAPSAVVSLIAPLTTKVMIYVMIRIALYVFTPDFTFAVMKVGHSFVWLAVAAIVMASILALSKRRLKSMLAYVVIAEVGYMAGGLWLGNRAGMTGAILHIVNDAAMTLCVFLAVGNIVCKLRADSFDSLPGLFRAMPVSMTALVIGALSIIGVPPTCGFFSKWYLMWGGVRAGHYGFVAALVFSSLINVVLFFRVFEIGFFEPFGDARGGDRSVLHEVPAGRLIPLIVVAVMLVVLGLYTEDIVTNLIQPALPPGMI